MTTEHVGWWARGIEMFKGKFLVWRHIRGGEKAGWETDFNFKLPEVIINNWKRLF